jgi:hypothetical protein
MDKIVITEIKCETCGETYTHHTNIAGVDCEQIAKDMAFLECEAEVKAFNKKHSKHKEKLTYIACGGDDD